MLGKTSLGLKYVGVPYSFEDVSFLRTEADAAVFRVGLGTYVFRREVADKYTGSSFQE